MRRYAIVTPAGVRAWQAESADHASEQHIDAFGTTDEQEDILSVGVAVCPGCSSGHIDPPKPEWWYCLTCHLKFDEPANTTDRLECLREQLRDERISYGEMAELQSLAKYIDPGDVELLEPAGVAEFPAYCPKCKADRSYRVDESTCLTCETPVDVDGLLDTSSYPFGETPHEVIREQGVQMDYPPGDLIQLRSNLFDIEWSVDDLLTVLDALAWQTTDAEFARQWPKRAERARKLRISILAALGVNES